MAGGYTWAMEIFSLAVLILVLIVVLYCARLLRALHTKVSRESERLLREIKSQTKNSTTSYRQIEAYSQLTNILDFKGVVPPARGWAASPDLLLAIVETIQRVKPSLVVELGSGVSTLVAAKAGAKKIVSIDNSSEYGGETRDLLKSHKVRGAQIRIAPLVSYGKESTWYDLSAIEDLKKIDLLIIDGPPGSTNPDARYPAIKEFKEKLSPKAIIIIDDVKREGERKLAEDFVKLLPNHKLVILDHEKGTAIISPR